MMQRVQTHTSGHGRVRFVLGVLAGALVFVARPAGAQWAEIGKTSIGNPVFVLAKSVATAKDGMITATVRATFVKPVKTARGELKASKTVVMIDCVKRTIAVRENSYFFDEGMKRVYEKTAPKIPGFSSPIKGTLPDIAMGHLCRPERSQGAAPRP